MWQYHDNKMLELKKLYQRASKQTQNRLQEIFDSFNITFNNLYNIADNKTKKRINTYVEEWKDKGLLNGYFGMLANSIYKRTRVKNNEILQLLIYSAYAEEQSKVQKEELDVFKDVANYYYQEGQKEVNKKKKASLIPDVIFFSLLAMSNVKGLTYEMYKQSMLNYNTEQIYKQCVIDLQQGKALDITNDIYQNIIKKQQNAKLSIKDNKISGDIDLTLIGLNNLAKVEGIKKESGNDARVMFLANVDGTETPMCHSLNNKEFYINKENVFDRYYGDTPKTLSIQRIRCKGLVLGLNLPPINYHFHWCRSIVKYIPNVIEKIGETEYNLDIPKISNEVKEILSDTKLNKKIKRLFNRYLTKDNVVIDTNNAKPMYYSIDKDKIIINPNHKEFKYYDLKESLSHEIIHMIDIRKHISDKLNIDSELRRARLSIDIDENKYIDMFNSEKYEDNMTLSDIFSAITNGKISGNYMHSSQYWLEDITRIEKELSANIMSAYLTDNKETLDIIDSISGLKEIKEKVVKLYNEYAR